MWRCEDFNRKLPAEGSAGWGLEALKHWEDYFRYRSWSSFWTLFTRESSPHSFNFSKIFSKLFHRQHNSPSTHTPQSERPSNPSSWDLCFSSTLLFGSRFTTQTPVNTQSNGMEDDLEEKVLKQACASQMKLLSKFAVGVFNRNSTTSQFLKFLLRPEVFLFAIIIFVFCFYLQAIELSANGFINRISNTLKFKSSSKAISFTSSIVERDSWEEVKVQSAVYAVQGRRPRMEDRWVPLSNRFPKNSFWKSPKKIKPKSYNLRILIDSENSPERAYFFPRTTPSSFFFFKKASAINSEMPIESTPHAITA